MFEKKKEQAKKEEPKESQEPRKITIEEAVEDNKALIDTLQRLQADFENFKKREEKNREEFAKFCTASIFFDLLEVMDAFESAMQKCTPEQNEAVEPLYYQLKKFLERNNVRQFSALNEMFNPELHEVLLTGYNSYKDENIVLEEIKKGYFVFDKVLRHAQVKINQKPVKKIEEIKNELKDQLNKLSGTEASAKKEREEQKSKDAVADKLFSKESASPQNDSQNQQKSGSQNAGDNPSRTISAGLNEEFTLKETYSAIIKETGLWIYWAVIDALGPSVILQISWQNMKDTDPQAGMNPTVTKITLKKGESKEIFGQSIMALDIDAAKKTARLVVKRSADQNNSGKSGEVIFNA